MKFRYSIAVAAAVGALAAPALLVQVRAGGDKVAFPENYAQGQLYTTIDRSDNKQYREFYTSAAAVEAAKKGEPLPSGTVITMVQYATKLDAAGNPEKDPNGRFIKTNIIGYAVMGKRAGWGAEYPEDIRNGEWEYQAFTAEKKVNDKADLAACFKCHKPYAKDDYLFTLDKMKSATR